MNTDAMRTEKTFPKLDATVIFRYFWMFPKVRRPSRIPSRSTRRSCSSKMMSAVSLAMSTPSVTLIPTSALRSAGVSLMPSPMCPTT